MNVFLEDEASDLFLASDISGAPLPSDILEVRRAHDDAVQALKAHRDECPDELRPVAKLMAAGMGLEDAEAEFEALSKEWDAWQGRQRNLLSARGIAANQANRAVTSQLDDLVLAVRETVTALVEECRPHAEKLKAYGPEFSTDHIVSRASAAEVKAYQAILEAQRKFDPIYRWWARACMNPRRLHQVSITPGFGSGKFFFAPETMDKARYVWERPELVTDARLNGKKLSRTGQPLTPESRLILIALEDPACGYRLATIEELRERAELEWNARRAADAKDVALYRALVV